MSTTGGPLAWFPYVVTVGYLIGGAVLIKLRQRRTGRYIYMPISAFLLPVYLGIVLQLLFYGLSFIWGAAALGLTSLYISLQSELAFRDPLTNLYNRQLSAALYPQPEEEGHTDRYPACGEQL